MNVPSATSNETAASPDAIVVGAGIIGAAIALELASSLDAENQPPPVETSGADVSHRRCETVGQR